MSATLLGMFELSIEAQAAATNSRFQQDGLVAVGALASQGLIQQSQL